MINDEIKNLRNKLNIMIQNGENSELIYEVSKQLDELIVEYYKEQM